MATYNPQSSDLLVPGVQAATELASHVGGFMAGCGFAALDVILNATRGVSTSPAEVTAIIQQATNQGQTIGAGGVATPANIEAVAQNDFGVTLQSFGYQQALSQYAGSKPIEIGVANAAAFGGADTGVHGHYITVVGRTGNGDFIVSDPNTSQSAAGQFVTYSPQQIANARPFWAGVPNNPIIGGSGSGSNPINALWGGALGGVIATLVGGNGKQSLTDFLWRSGLIIAGGIIVLVGIIAFTISGQEHNGAMLLDSEAGQATQRAVGRAAKA